MTSPIPSESSGPSVASSLDPSASLAENGIVVAMSGGVDSSVAAWLLREAGRPLIGLFMRNGVHVGEHESAKKSCCSVSDARDARMVAAGLGIPFQSVDLKDEFGAIIRYFLAEYSAGRTPNPCAVCNRDLKFGRLLRFARELGAAGVATGHYAQIDHPDGNASGRVRVRRGVDRSKDQSYQLFCVAEADLAYAHLPIGGMAKRDVRALASKVGLRTAEKADSQEICFVPSNDYRKLLAERGVELHAGKLVDTSGRVLGEHAGTEHFTIGQRRGHGVAGVQPLYVVAVLPETGTVVLGTRDECHARSMRVRELNWIGFDAPSSNEFVCEVQVRYHHDPARCTVHVEGREATVVFDEPQLAIAAGQGAAFYLDDRLLGGGWIASSSISDAAAHRAVAELA
ncbi:MAG: tRNA 2-thiouridine(34) synthase MnmA [Planctomycetes bacterium]|nr:tRNA 2-thiouridine(34) synthase MnmA [Planctomycetota bacterium]